LSGKKHIRDYILGRSERARPELQQPGIIINTYKLTLLPFT